MRRLIHFFELLIPPTVLAAAFMSTFDVVSRQATVTPPPIGAQPMETVALATSVSIGAGLVYAVALIIVLFAAHSLLLRLHWTRLHEVEFVRATYRLGVAESGDGWRAWGSAAVSVAFAVLWSNLSERVLRDSGLNNVMLVIAYAVWTTAGAVVPVVLFRLLAWKRPRWAPVDWVVWLFLALWAYSIAVRYWAGASVQTLWLAFPLYMIPGIVAAVCIAERPRVRRLFNVSGAVLAVAAVIVMATYPERSLAHAQMSSGPIVGPAGWQVMSRVLDLDGDGASHLLGGVDCDGLDYDIRVTAVEIPGNGIDDNCFGGDLPAIEPLQAREAAPVLGHPDKPPVIIITIDTLRADALKRVVDGRQVSPFLDAFLEGGVYFSEAYSTAAATDEAVPALMSGMYPSDWHQHGVYFGVEPTMAEIFGKLGYQTAAVILMPWLRASLVRGFDVIDNSLGERHFRDESWISSAKITDLALEHLDSMDPGQPRMLWVHYFDTHGPRFPHVPADSWLGGDRYAQNVHLVDGQFGRFIVGLDERGLLERALIILASDHGEGLGEHGIETHGWGVWESIIRIPLAIRLPGVSPREIDTPVSLVDVLPTIFDYFSLEDGIQRDGRSLMPAILGRPMESRPIFIEAPIAHRSMFFAVIHEGMKLIFDLVRGAYYLFDLEEDPEEAVNLIEARPEVADKLRDLLGRWRDGVFNEARLDRKRALWESRSKWKPRELITSERSLSKDEQLRAKD